VIVRHPCRPPCMTPRCSDRERYLSCTPGHRHCYRWAPWLARTSPTPPCAVTSLPTSPSPQRPIPRDALAPDLSYTMPRPCQTDVAGLSRVHSVCVVFSCTCSSSSSTQHAHLHGIEPSMSPYPRPALPRTGTLPRHTILPPATLKPLVLRVNRPATDTACLSPGLDAQCHP
jgi:hypothetical protein